MKKKEFYMRRQRERTTDKRSEETLNIRKIKQIQSL